MDLKDYQNYLDYLDQKLDNLKKQLKEDQDKDFLFKLEHLIKDQNVSLKKHKDIYKKGISYSLKFNSFLREKNQEFCKKQYDFSIKFLEDLGNNFIKNNKPDDTKVDLLDYSNFLLE